MAEFTATWNIGPSVDCVVKGKYNKSFGNVTEVTSISISGQGDMYDTVGKYTYTITDTNISPYNWSTNIEKWKGVSLIIPDGVTSVSDYFFDTTVFDNKHITEQLVLGNDVRYIGKHAFSTPNSCTKNNNGKWLFKQYWGFRNIIVLGNKIKYIGSNAFMGQSIVKSINFGGSVKAVASEAFKYCFGLEELDLAEDFNSDGTLKQRSDYTFEYCLSLKKFNNGNKIYKPYITDKYGDIVKSSIGHGMFKHCFNLTHFEFVGDKINTLNLSFYVDKFDGVNCDADGNLITTVINKEAAVMGPNQLPVDWIAEYNRAAGPPIVPGYDLLILKHLGRDIKIKCSDTAVSRIALKHNGKVYYLRLVKENDTDRSPLVVKDGNRLLYIGN